MQQSFSFMVLVTGDDLARLGTRYTESNKNHEDLIPQARPNVLFEAGMAMGRNAERTIIVQFGEVRPFSDIAGRHTIYLDNSHKKKMDLVSRLKIAGCKINIEHKKDWMDTGDFDNCIEWPDVEANVQYKSDNTDDKVDKLISMDENDIIAILQSWMGSRNARLNTRVIKYHEVDEELSLPSGSAKNFIEIAALKWNYTVERKGESTIIFKENPRQGPKSRPKSWL
jgi:hypothetical protein